MSLAGIVAVGLLLGAATVVTGELADWQSTELVDHPLVGVVLGPDDRPVTPAELVEALAGVPVVLLGETHDNPDHHRLRTWVLYQLAAAGRRPAVVFEHVHRGQADVFAECQAQRCDLDAALPARLDWQDNWPDWVMFRPLFAAVRELGLQAVAGNAPGDEVRALADGERMPDDRLAQLLEARPEHRRRELLEILRASHCDLLPESAIHGMAVAQTARDLAMAEALMNSPEALLLAGNGHVDKALGVPWVLSELGDDRDRISVVFAGVPRDETNAPAARRMVPDADYVWFTPRATLIDPCQRMREAMRGKDVS